MATGETPTVEDLPVGTNSIQLTVTDNDGDIDTDLVSVTVTAVVVPNEPPIANAGPNQTVVEGATVQLDGSDSDDSDGTIASFQWVLGSVEVATGETPTVDDLPVGTNSIQLTVTDDDGDIATDLVAVTVTAVVVPNEPPTANAGPDQTVEEGAAVQLDGSDSDDSDGTIASFQWVLDGVDSGDRRNANC